MPIQGLLQSIPQLDPSLANKGAPIMGGLQAAQQMQLQQAQAQHQQLQNHIAQLQTTQQLAAMVRYNPTQQNYDMVRNVAANSGLGDLVSKLPPDIRDAGPFIESAYWASGQGLAAAKAQASILNDQVLMGKNAAQANQSNFQQGQKPVFPGAAAGGLGPNGTGIPTPPPMPTWGNSQQGGGMQQLGGGQPSNALQGSMMPQPSAMGAGSPIQTPQGMGGQQLQPVSSVPSYTPSALGNSQLTGPAEMEKQKAQGKDWADFTSAYGDVNKNYLPMKQTLDQLDVLNNQGLNKYDLANPTLMGKAVGLSQKGQMLNKLGDALNLNYIAALTKSGGISRLDIPIVKAARGLTPSTDLYPENRTVEVNRLRLINEQGNAMAQLLPTLDQMGMRDKNQALDVLKNAVIKTNSIDNTNGGLNMQKFQDWPQNLPQKIKDAYFTNNYVNKGVPVFKKPDGNYFTGDKIQTMAQHYNISPDAIVKKYNLKPALQSPYALNQQQQQQLAQAQQQNPQIP